MAKRIDIAPQTDTDPDASTSLWPAHWPQFRVSERRILLMVGDVIGTLCAIVLSLLLWAQRAHKAFTTQFVLPQVHWFVILPVLWLVLANANDYYSLRVAADLSSSLKRLVLVTGEILLIYLMIFFVYPPGTLPRRFIVYYAVTSLCLIGIWRACRLFLIGWTGFRRRALIVGTGRAADIIWHAIKEDANGDYEVVGRVSSTHDLATLSSESSEQRLLGTGDDLPRLAQAHGVTELIMAYTNEVPDDVFQGVMTCYEQGVVVVPMTVLYEQVTGRIPIEQVGEHMWPLVLPAESHLLAMALYRVVKRLMDVVFGVIGLIVFALLLIPLALVIKIDSRGPVFYHQVRLGQAGKPFTVLKLRSMFVGAEHLTGPRWAVDRDPNVTPAGKWLRKTRLDEMPQFLNVLRGEMSIIGPRPERPEFVQMLANEISFYRARLAVKPGLSGWAQVRFRYGSTTADALRKLQYDLYYIRHQSLLLDVNIVLRTIGTLLLLRGR